MTAASHRHRQTLCACIVKGFDNIIFSVRIYDDVRITFRFQRLPYGILPRAFIIRMSARVDTTRSP